MFVNPFVVVLHNENKSKYTTGVYAIQIMESKDSVKTLSCCFYHHIS